MWIYYKQLDANRESIDGILGSIKLDLSMAALMYIYVKQKEFVTIAKREKLGKSTILGKNGYMYLTIVANKSGYVVVAK